MAKGGKLSIEELKALAESLKAKHALSELDLRLLPSGDVRLETMAANPTGTGAGSKAMDDLVRFADENQLRMVLGLAEKGYQPIEGGPKTTSTNRLRDFYRRFGFVPNRGRNKDYALSIYDSMYRKPKEEKAKGGRTTSNLTALRRSLQARKYALSKQWYVPGKPLGLGLSPEKIEQLKAEWKRLDDLDQKLKEQDPIGYLKDQQQEHQDRKELFDRLMQLNPDEFPPPEEKAKGGRIRPTANVPKELLKEQQAALQRSWDKLHQISSPKDEIAVKTLDELETHLDAVEGGIRRGKSVKQGGYAKGGKIRDLFKRLHGAEASHEGYAYHGTNLERAEQIAEEGLKLHKPHEFTDQDAWPDGSTQKRNYFTPTAENTWQFAPEEGPGVLLRVRRDAHPFKQEGTGDLYSTKPVPPENIEFLGGDGQWHAMAPIKKAKGGKVKWGTNIGQLREDVKHLLKGTPLGGAEPQGRTPDVNWHDRDLQDSQRATPESILKDYGRGKGTVHMRWVAPWELPQPKGSGIRDGRPVNEPMPLNEGELEDFDEDLYGYDWSELAMSRRGTPPLKVRVNPRGKVELLDGNHRLAWWLEQDMDTVPVYVIDERKKPGYAKGGKVSSVRTAVDELREYAHALAPQRGMFSTLDELVQQAPFERGTAEQWRGYLKPGRMLKREGMQFPLKKEELEQAFEGPMRTTFGERADTESFTRDQILEAMRTQRPEFNLGVAIESTSPGYRYSSSKAIERLAQLGDIATLTDQDRRLLEEGARKLGTSRVHAYNPAYGPSQSGYERLSHQSPGSEYEESITDLKGLKYPTHFNQDTLSWSRTSQHDVPDVGKVRLIEEIQSDLHQDAAERVGNTHTQQGLQDMLVNAGLWDQYKQTNAEEARISRRRADILRRQSNEQLHWSEEAALDKELEELRLAAAYNHDNRQELVNEAYDKRPRRGYRSQEALEELRRQHEAVRGEMNASVSGENRDYETHDKKLAEAQQLAHQIGVMQEKPPEAPFASPKEYGLLEIRKQLLNAAHNNEDYLAITRGEHQVERNAMEGEDDEKAPGMLHIYDNVYRGIMNDLARQYGAEVVDVPISTGTGADVRPRIMRDAGVEDVREFMDDEHKGHIYTGAHGDDPYDILIYELTPEGTYQTAPYDRARNAVRAYRRAQKAEEDTSDELMELDEALETLWHKHQETHSGEVSEEKTFPAIKLTPEVRERILKAGAPVWSIAGGALPLAGEILRQHDQEGTPEPEPGFAEGGEVDYPNRELYEHIAKPDRPARRELSSLRDLVKRIGHGFSTQWTGLDDAGIPRGLTNNDWAAAGPGGGVWDAPPGQAFVPETPALPGIVDETLALPDLFTLGHGPAWATEASERSQALDEALRAQEGIGEPGGVEDYAAEALGMMMGQLPVPGGAGKKAGEAMFGPLARIFPKAARPVAERISKIPGAAMEWFSPTIEPTIGNYLTGTAAGTAITMELPKLTEAVLEHMDRDNPWRVATQLTEAYQTASPEEQQHMLPPDMLFEIANQLEPQDFGEAEQTPNEDDQAMISNLLGEAEAD